MKRLARALSINRAFAVGLLESLWHWAGRFAPQGDIGKHEDVDIADGCFWDREPKELIDALMSSGWVDANEIHRLVIHDWKDHADEAVRKLLARNNLPFLPMSRQCLDNVSTPSATLPATCGYGDGSGTGSGTGKAVEMILPAGFPRTEEEAKAHCPFIGVTEEFACKVWNLAYSRGGKDSKEVPILNFRSYLKTQYTYAQENKANGKHNAAGKPSRPSRNEGTYNEGVKSLSHLVRRPVQNVENPPRSDPV